MSFKNPLSVCYLTTNTNDPSNLGSYVLADGTCLFDIGILFAANINGTEDKPELFLNDSVIAALNPETIRALQAKGMKVIISILGNHHPAGISSLTDKGVKIFADQIVKLVNDYGLDGLDFDDEWSDGTPNDSSFPLLISNVRNQLPDKLLTFYFIGGASRSLSYEGINVGDLLDYAWNPYYGTYEAPVIPGMSNAQLGAAAVNLNPEADSYTPQATADDFATRTLENEYGVYMSYNLINGNISPYLSSISEILYNQETTQDPLAVSVAEGAK